MKKAAIVVLYNFSQSEINHIKTYASYVDTVILVDNSTKESSLNIFKQIPNTVYISMKGNQGIAAALNSGMEYAIQENFKWVLTMDQDSGFENNILSIYDTFIETHAIDDVLLLAPTYKIDRKKWKKKRKQYQNCYWVMQSANLVQVSLYQKLGLYKKDFFIDWVDYEYCLRAHKKGYKMIQCGQAIVKHNPGITHQKKIMGMILQYGYADKERIYYQVRNALCVAVQYKSLKAFLIVCIKWLKIFLLFDHKKAYFKYFYKAVDDYKNHRYGKIGDEKSW